MNSGRTLEEDKFCLQMSSTKFLSNIDNSYNHSTTKIEKSCG